jgi:hypothetical protein
MLSRLPSSSAESVSLAIPVTKDNETENEGEPTDDVGKENKDILSTTAEPSDTLDETPRTPPAMKREAYDCSVHQDAPIIKRSAKRPRNQLNW